MGETSLIAPYQMPILRNRTGHDHPQPLPRSPTEAVLHLALLILNNVRVGGAVPLMDEASIHLNENFLHFLLRGLSRDYFYARGTDAGFSLSVHIGVTSMQPFRRL